MMKKIIKRIFFTLVLLLGLFFTSSWWIGRKWGRDASELKVTEGALSFTAQRNSVGVWKIRTQDPESLWFAFGYVHSYDREFQMELMRQMALGRLSAWFGPTQVARDRLMRLVSRSARAEWDALPSDSPLRRAAEAFVAGRRARLKDWPDRWPIEFRIFSLTRVDVADWEPWHVLAVSRLHTWEFSYDLLEEIRSQGLRKHLGAELAGLLSPREPADSPEVLYKQAGVKGVRPKLQASSPTEVPELVMPEGERVASAPSVKSPESFLPWGDTVLGAELGASNAWIVADPRTDLAPTLCNDAHLGFSWPSPLYPIEYVTRESGNAVEGQGYMLPGSPAVVIGRVDRGERSLAWGITMANYSDTQDLVALSKDTLEKAAHVKESFTVRDPKTFQVSEQTSIEEWTAFGPRVDGFLDWKGADPGVPVALDWMGFRRVPSPLEFYIRRNLQGQEGLREDLARGWAYPAVNFNWMERDPAEGTRIGHLVTGLIYERKRSAPRDFLSEAEARSRKFSRPSERPYLDFLYDGKDDFLLVTGNQAVFPQPLGGRLGYEWMDRARASVILSDRQALLRDPPHAQTDFRSGALLDFVKIARGRVSADRLCAEGASGFLESCFEVVAALDRWDGAALEQRWEPTLAAMWYSKAKEALWPKTKQREGADVFVGWHRSNGSMLAVSNLLHSESARAQWEKLTGLSWDEVLSDAFRESLNLLVEQLGPLTSSWAWGRVHRIEWQHPVKFIPEPVGSLLAQSLFGPPPSVPGSLDTPGRFDFQWNPKAPVDFPSKHGAAMRMCVSMPPKGPSRMRWTGATGVSGNPLSKWAWPFATEGYYQGTLLSD